ncbi:hypothetical protein EON63_22335 [archaeon]|nr:MAG: hypothetical protein EON63_22335 [archaeon]
MSISDFLTLFSCRTGEKWFWQDLPSAMLGGAACMALTASTVLAVSWPESKPDGIYTIGTACPCPYSCPHDLTITITTILGLGRKQPYTLALYIWIYCIVWWFIQDAFKVRKHTHIHTHILPYPYPYPYPYHVIQVATYHFLKTYNIFGYNDTGKLKLPESTLKYIAENRQRDLEQSFARRH